VLKDRMIRMNRQDLIAPEQYNIAMEIEKYTQDPERVAVIWEDDQGNKEQITYASLIENANRIGNVFLDNGLKKGDKLLVMMPRVIETYAVYIAALKTGIILIPSSEMLRTSDLEYRITHGEVSGIVSYHAFTDQFNGIEQWQALKKFAVGGEVAAEGWNKLEHLKDTASEQLKMVETTRDDIAFLPYTSGTTGNPKAVMHTHGWGYAHLKTAPANWLSIRDGDKVWATAAPGWQKWVWSPLLSVLGSGATGFVYAGKPLNRHVIDQFEKYVAVTVLDGYGQTENTLLLGFLKGMKVKPGSMGKPTPGNHVQLIDEDCNPVAVGEVGDIAIPLDTPALFQAYYKDPERTRKSQRGNFYVTGDQASMDEEGYFWFEGRNDDIIVSSG